MRVSTPELNIQCAEGEHHALIAQHRRERATFPGATDVIRIDGLRVEYPDGFGLARASNTTPVIVLRFEADDEAALARIQDEFRRVLADVRSRASRCRSDDDSARCWSRSPTSKPRATASRGGIYESPCVESIPLSQLTGAHVYCKLDYLQRTGSFKERGARNALLSCSPDARASAA